jgi:hypothetical protein
MDSFQLEVLVDFLDDAMLADHVWTERDVDCVMRALARVGVTRVSWAYYADDRGGFLMPEGLRDRDSDWGQCKATYRALQNPLRAAVEAGHRHGIEVYAYFKPYEMGVSMVIPEGSPEARAHGLLPCVGGQLAVLDPFVRDNPHLRIKRRTDDLPGNATAPIGAIRLTKRDDSPTRVTREHLQIWTSADNYQYELAPVPFTLTETVETSKTEVRDHAGTVITPEGDPVRVLTLSGFSIDTPYVLVTTDFEDGNPDFSHSGAAMIAAFDDSGCEIAGEVATGVGVWLGERIDFRKWGLVFDFGWGKAVTSLDTSNASGRQGFIAFARGKNSHLPAALCETEPAVQAFWLNCLREIIAAGVDGVDFREENHCTHTDEPEDFGFNQVVLDQCRAEEDLQAEVARVRGEAYTEFLRKAHTLLAASGLPLRYNLNVDYFRPAPPHSRALAYPANIGFEWQKWLAEGLVDEAILRSYHYREQLLTDPIGAEMVEACQKAGVPISYNHHVFNDDPWYREEAVRAASDGRFAGLVLYELSNFLGTSTDGTCSFNLSIIEDICQIIRELGS